MGFDVVGVTFRLWEHPSRGPRRNNLCCSREGVEAAKALCKKLNIPHILLDVSPDFFDYVVKNFIDEYASGRTPSPCILCNPLVKWRHLIALADDKGIEKVATGHYARSLSSPTCGKNLLRGADGEKDQSYFLYRLTAEQLARTIFPVGHITKEASRKIAAIAALPVSSPRESQELCFLPDGDLVRFFKKFIPQATEPGPIVDTSGKVVGKHRGIAFYTPGQRSGLGGGFPEPMYVREIIAEENKIVIGTAREIYTDRFTVNALILRRPVGREFMCTVRIRHRHRDVPARVRIAGDCAHITLQKPQRAVAPGQSAVFYDGLIVLGGGTISSTKLSNCT